MANTLRTRQPHRLWAVWLALLVALFGAMAPTVSHALVFAKGGSNGFSNVIEICTPQGPRAVAVQDASSADSLPSQESARTLDHCPFCLHAADHAAPPVHPQAPCVQVDDGALLHTPCTAHPHPKNAYAKASPRGPPARY